MTDATSGSLELQRIAISTFSSFSHAFRLLLR